MIDFKYEPLSLERIQAEQDKYHLSFCPKLPLQFESGSEDLIQQMIEKYSREQEKENALWIICEMAKEYMNFFHGRNPMTINEFIEICPKGLSIGLADRNGDELFLGDKVLFHKTKFVYFPSKEDAEEHGFNTDGHYSEWYPTGKVTRYKGEIAFDMGTGWYIAGSSTSPHRYDVSEGRLINIEKISGEDK